jgi:hypothetical protein
MKNLATLMKSSILKLMVALIGIFFWTSINSFAQTAPDYSGTWKLNLTKSTPIPGIVSSTLLITQKENRITINRTLIIKDNKPLVHTDNFIMEGEFGFKSVNGNKSGTIKSFWGPDKMTFSVIETSILDKDGIKQESKRRTVYSLIDQGKTLNIVSDDSIPAATSIPNGRMHSVSVYVK